jgi:hypothetical protein
MLNLNKNKIMQTLQEFCKLFNHSSLAPSFAASSASFLLRSSSLLPHLNFAKYTASS